MTFTIINMLLREKNQFLCLASNIQRKKRKLMHYLNEIYCSFNVIDCRIHLQPWHLNGESANFE